MNMTALAITFFCTTLLSLGMWWRKVHVTHLSDREWWKFSDNSCAKIVDLHCKVAMLELTIKCDQHIIEMLAKQIKELKGEQSCSTPDASTSTNADQSQLSS